MTGFNIFQDTFINGHCSAASQAFFFIFRSTCSMESICAVLIRHRHGTAASAHHHPISLRLGSSAIVLAGPCVSLMDDIFPSRKSLFHHWYLLCHMAIVLAFHHARRLPVVAISGENFCCGCIVRIRVLACWNLAVGLPAWLAYFSIILLRGSRKVARCIVIAAEWQLPLCLIFSLCCQAQRIHANSASSTSTGLTLLSSSMRWVVRSLQKSAANSAPCLARRWLEQSG